MNHNNNLSKNFIIPTEQDMMALAGDIAKKTSGGKIIFLCGDLGAGKTTFTRGFLKALGHAGKVKSPTYTLVEEYELKAIKIYHFDLYRLEDVGELELMGFRDYLRDDSIVLIEWPQRAADYLPKPNMKIDIAIKDIGREVEVFYL